MRPGIIVFISALLLATYDARAAGVHPLPSFTESQAAQGQAVYENACAVCHGKKLEGTFETPSLTGRFIQKWRDVPIMELYAYIHRAMPQMAPGSLSPEETSSVIAYILQQNSIAPGKTPLSSPPNSLHLQFMPHSIAQLK